MQLSELPEEISVNNTFLNKFVNYLSESNPLHLSSLLQQMPLNDKDYVSCVESLLVSFNDMLEIIGKNFEYGVECYNRKVYDLVEEQIHFISTGSYRYSSYDEVNSRVYADPEVMEYHTIGLLLMQIIRTNNYKKLIEFKKILNGYKNKIHYYLEIAGGHGLFTGEAAGILGTNTRIDFIDISGTSIKIAQSFLKNSPINFYEQDVFNFSPGIKYDFITMGEILEHLEHPEDLLLKMKSLLAPGGLCFITIPINSAAIDHIYLFRNEQEIRDMLQMCDLKIITGQLLTEYANRPAGIPGMPHSYWALISA